AERVAPLVHTERRCSICSPAHECSGDAATDLSILDLLGLSFGRARIIARARVSHHAYSLNLDFDAGPSEIRHGDEGAAGIVSIFEEIFAHFDKPVAITGFLDEHGHGYHIVQASAGAFHDAVDLRKNLFDLSFEVVGDVVALAVLRGSLSGNPDDRSAGRDNAWRKRARQLERCLSMYSAACAALESNMASNRTAIRFICGLLTNDKGLKATSECSR